MKAKLVAWTKRLGAPALGLGLLGAVVWRNDPAEIARQMQLGNPAALLPWAIGMPFVFLALQTIWDGWVLERVVGGPPYRDLIRGKAGSAILSALGYLLGTGGYAVWIARRTRTRPATVAGLITYVTVSDIGALAIVAFAATTLLRRDATSAVGSLAAVVIGIELVMLLLVPSSPSRPSGSGRWSAALEPWRRVPRTIGVAQLGGRALTVTACGTMMWLGARSFGLELPLSAAAAYIPVLMLLTSLPVNIAGFGAAQAGWVLAFSAWAPPARILAFHLLWQLGMNVGIVLRGLPFLARTLREIAGETAIRRRACSGRSDYTSRASKHPPCKSLPSLGS